VIARDVANAKRFGPDPEDYAEDDNENGNGQYGVNDSPKCPQDLTGIPVGQIPFSHLQKQQLVLINALRNIVCRREYAHGIYFQ
jgi:hypothetical protein